MTGKIHSALGKFSRSDARGLRRSSAVQAGGLYGSGGGAYNDSAPSTQFKRPVTLAGAFVAGGNASVLIEIFASPRWGSTGWLLAPISPVFAAGRLRRAEAGAFYRDAGSSMWFKIQF